MNVYEEDNYPYLREETFLISNALNQGMPVLGFCLGSQMMAKACGSGVFKGHIKEIGWYSVRLTEDGKKDPILRGLPDEFPVFQWHGDTFQIPESGTCLIKSDEYPNQVMRIGETAYGFQFHFEVTERMIEEWLRTGKKEINALNVTGLHEKILKDASYYLPKIHSIAEIFLNNYLYQIEG
jgi:GMP synthase-like glutamine amidotransferase